MVYSKVLKDKTIYKKSVKIKSDNNTKANIQRPGLNM